MADLVHIATLNQANPIVDGQGRPLAAFLRSINDAFQQLASALNQIAAIPEIQSALAAAQTAITDAQNAADAANAAAATAQSAAVAANDNAKLANSYISPASVLNATPTTITIAAHTRYYADGTSVAVSGGTVAATVSGDTDYISYSDPAFAGGAVAYQVSTINPAQVGSTHVVGAVTIPAAGSATGGKGPSKPGTVQP